MKKKSMVAMFMTMTVLLSGCGERTDLVKETVIMRDNENWTGCVEGCICYETAPTDKEQSSEETSPESEQETMTQTAPAETQETIESEQEQSDTQESTTEPQEEDISQLSEGELVARREQQKNFEEARELLYTLKNSKDKTSRINQMDRQILANNAYDFSDKNIVFIGDSITEGITSAVDINGNRISYVTYADSYLHFKKTLNHGMGGRMFSVYGDEELSLALNFGNVTNVDSDIIVVFAGINDYLSTPANKRFGDVNDKLSTAGYCGSVRYFMKQLQEYYANREIFFVTTYNTTKTVECNYTDINGQPTLNDYMEVQRKLAKEFGFHVIDLYSTGFMDCSDKASSDFYLRDGLHPKDNGNIVLGEHIAAELSLYFGEKEVDK